MRMIWIAVLAAGICQPLHADDGQTLSPGLWEFTTTTSGAAQGPDRTQLCTDAGTADLVKQLSGGLMPGQCSKEQKTQGDTTTIDSICQVGPSKVSAHTITVVSGDKAYHGTTTLHYDPPLAGNSESSLTSDAKWIGSCTEGMKPGDLIMPNGMKVNINNMLSSMRASAAAVAQTTTNPPDNGRPVAYDKKPVTLHSTGKWYFEATLNVGQIAKIMPTTVAVGLLDYSNPQSISIIGTMTSIQASDLGLEILGIAADLDNGKVYIRKDGAWTDGLPGSNQGADIKLGRSYHATVMVSAKEANQKYFDSGAIAPDFGDKPMVYALPDGYLPWRASNRNDSAGATPR